MIKHASVIFCFLTVIYCANIGLDDKNGISRAKRDVDVTSVDEVSQNLEAERRKMVNEKLDIVSEKRNSKTEEDWREYRQKWNEYGNKWEAYGARRDAEHIHGNRNKREEDGLTKRAWDAVGQNWKAHGQEWKEYGKKWEAYGGRQDAELTLRGNRNKRDERGQKGNTKWDAIGQKWNEHGQEWQEYGKKWDNVGKNSANH